MTHKDVRTIEDALALVDEKARGRTRWPDQPPYIDEMLAGEVRRLREALRKYGCHQVTCSHNRSYSSRSCSCGYLEALEVPYD